LDEDAAEEMDTDEDVDMKVRQFYVLKYILLSKITLNADLGRAINDSSEACVHLLPVI